jgi:cell division protein FtsB
MKRMWAEWKAKQKPEPRKQARQVVATNPAAATPAEFEQLTPSKQKAEYEKVLHRYESAEDKIAKLKEENNALKEENAQLKQQLKSIRDQARRMIS